MAGVQFLSSSEALWDEFVVSAGGQLVRNLVPKDVKENNADYVFRNTNAIAELKSLEEETFTLDYHQKLQQLAQGWMAKRWIRAYGRVQLHLRTLPPQCQREWLKLLETPIQRLVAKANKQVKSTKELLSMQDASGILILASDGNSSLAPYDVIALVSRVWQKRHPDGRLLYSSLNDLIYINPNMPVYGAGVDRPALCWFSGYRQRKPEVSAFLDDLESKWFAFLERKLGFPIPPASLSHEEVESLKFIELLPVEEKEPE